MIVPDDMLETTGKVFAGEYDLPAYVRKNPVILDIGAGIGAFTRWAKIRWPDSIIYAYEPLPECVEYLSKNVSDLKGVFIHQCAVGAESGTRTLYYGGNTRAMNSFEKSQYTREYGVTVSVKAAANLQKADLIKCDTEGAEIEILENLPFDPEVILVEYHSVAAKSYLEKMYAEKYTLFEFKYTDARSGNLKFVRNDLVESRPSS